MPTCPYLRSAVTRLGSTGLLAVGLFALVPLLSARSSRTRQRDELSYRCVVVEDAEDGDTAGWSLYDDPGPEQLANELEGKGERNRVITLKPKGSIWDTGYRLTLPPDQRDLPKLQWRMRFTESFIIYVDCSTTLGNLYLLYKPSDGPVTFDGVKYVTVPLGRDKGIGEWTTLRRDLQADLQKGNPDIKLLEVRGFLARGAGMLDDIRLYEYADADHDLLPDEFEERRKMNPKDPRDATEKLVEEAVALTESVAGRAKDKPEDQAAERQGNGGKGDRNDGKGEAANTAERERAPRRRVTLSDAEQDQVQTFFEERYAQRLAAAAPPQIGKRYRVRMREGEEITGELLQFADGRIVLQTAHGSIALPIHRVSRRDTVALFPREAARQLAMQDVQRKIDELIESKVAAAAAAAPAVTAAEAPVTTAAPAVAEVQPELVATVRDERVGTPTYDPRPAPSPPTLKPAMQAFGQWLVAQQERAGGRIASQLFAKEHEGNAVLYVVTAADFLAQDYDTRHRTAVGIQQFWGFRCQSMGVADLASAHVVLLDGNGRVVGGSRPEDAADIWVSER